MRPKFGSLGWLACVLAVGIALVVAAAMRRTQPPPDSRWRNRLPSQDLAGDQAADQSQEVVSQLPDASSAERRSNAVSVIPDPGEHAPAAQLPQSGEVKTPAAGLAPVHDQTTPPANGFYQAHYADGLVSEEGRYERGEKEGPWTYWSESGKRLLEGGYVRGRAVGMWRSWHENGRLAAEVYCADGEFDGACSFWKENGELDPEKTGHYKMGTLVIR